VYNLDRKRIKRAIKISDIVGNFCIGNVFYKNITAITKNNCEKNLEFVIHVPSESDYRFKVDKLHIRDEIFSVIKANYSKLTGK